MLKFLKNWTLPIAMLVGAVGYPLFICLSFLTPYLIFTMLLLTFCKVSPRDLKLRQLHVWLLLIQIIGALAAYLLLFRFHQLHRQIQVSFDICRIYNIDDAARMLVQNEIPGDDLFA